MGQPAGGPRRFRHHRWGPGVILVSLAMVLSACGGADDTTGGIAEDPATDDTIEVAPITLPDALQTFWDAWVEAMALPDTDFLLSHLHPAIIDQYGIDQCEEAVSRLGSQEFIGWPIGVSDKANWTLAADGIGVLITDTYTISYVLGPSGRGDVAEVHIAEVDGGFRWFADCGEPLETPGGPSVQE